MKIIPSGLTALSFILLSFIGVAQAQTSPINTEPNIDWQKLASDDHNLSVLGDNLMGDMIDYNNGGVTFEHTDVDIPGNSALSVAVKRRLTRGINYDKSESSGFGDWEIVAPRIFAKTAPGTNFRTGNRCSGINQFQTLNLRKNYRHGNIVFPVTPPTGQALQTLPHQYSQGMQIETTEYGSEKLLKSNVAGALGPYSSTEKYVTRSNFKVSCLSNITGGGEGFLAKSPDGYTYTFDRFYERRTEDDILSNYYAPDQVRYKSIIAATEVTDIHGNWVKYEYDAHDRLIRIHSNDGREITISYSGINSPISSVTANGRTWTYEYATNTVTYNYIEWGTNGPYGTQPFDSLTRVTLPDGRKWHIDNVEMFRSSEIGGCTLDPTASIGGDRYGLYMQHPSGVWGKFKFDMVRKRVGHDLLESRSVQGSSNLPGGEIPNATGVTLACAPPSGLDSTIAPDGPSGSIPNVPAPPDEGQGNAPGTAGSTPTMQANLIMYKAMPALVKKVLSGEIMETFPSEIEPMIWTIDYEEAPLVHYQGPANIPPVAVADRTNWTKVTQPDGTEQTYYYHWDDEPLGGELKRDELRASVGSSTILRANDYTHVIQSPSVGVTNFVGAYPPASQLNPVYQTDVVTTQDGDTFTRKTEYNLDITSSTYSFGKPTAVELTSNVSTTPRRIETTYEHQLNNWILGLPKTQSLNGTQAVSYTYNGVGLKTAQSRYTQSNYYTFTYHPDGTPASATDALGNVVEASSWKRGSPQTTRRWLDRSLNGNENRWLTTSTVMDNNGWVTSFTDPKGHVTGYQYDVMGRITQINPPGSYFNNTGFAYNFAATGDFPITQTITKGSATTTVHYDQLHRPRRVAKIDGSWSSVVETEYDNRNRPVFTSNPSSLIGARVQYDALGRPVANWAGDRASTPLTGELLTTTAYLNNHRVQTTDPMGFVTTRHMDGYAGPGGGDLLQIDEPGRRTLLTRDSYGLLTLLRQEELAGPKSVEQHFRYDADKRLCAHFVPEHGQSHFTYHDNGWLKRSSKGEAETTSGCPSPNASLSTDRIYDSLGRVIATNFVPAGTLDVGNIYDESGNLLETRRGVFNTSAVTMPSSTVVNERHRTYDALNNVTAETQQIDGAHVAFLMQYSYDANGFMNSRRYPSNNLYEWTNNGFGQQQHLRQGSYYYANNVTYHPDGSLAGYTMGNGQAYTRTLDSLQRTDRIRSVGSQLTALDLDYSYNPKGQIASVIDSSSAGINAGGKTHAVTGLQYDGLGQMTHANGWWGNGTFTYDGLGNLLSKSLGAGTGTARTVALTYDLPTNRVTISNDSLGTVAGGTAWRSIQHDTRGNMTQLGALQMQYDLTDQMISNTGAANGIGFAVATYQYNGEGKRVQMNANGRNSFYVYDSGGRLVLSHKEMDGEGVEQLYLEAGPKLAKWTGTKLTYFHTDHLGTPIRSTHGMGGTETVGSEVSQDFSTPYGMQPTAGWYGLGHSGFNPATGQGSNCGVTGFTTHVKDCETGLQYMQARYYDPVLSRFTSIDPVGFLQQPYPAQINRYAYTWNNPINAYDPDGEFINFIVGGVIGAAIETGSQLVANGGDFSALDGGAIFKSAAIGSISGGVGGLVGKQVLTKAAPQVAAKANTAFGSVRASAASGAIEGGVGAGVGDLANQLTDDQAGINLTQTAGAAASGAALGAVSGGVNQGARNASLKAEGIIEPTAENLSKPGLRGPFPGKDTGATAGAAAGATVSTAAGVATSNLEEEE